MHIFSCTHEFNSIMTCLYRACASHLPNKEVYLCYEPIEQMNLFDEYTHVDPDPELAAKLMDLIHTRISSDFYEYFALAALSYEDAALDLMYRMLLLGFHHGPAVLSMRQYREVCDFLGVRERVSKEVYRFQEFARFHEVRKGVYIAHIEPRHAIVQALGGIFEDRMPSEHFMIVDDIHRDAVIHMRDEHFYYRTLDPAEFEELLKTEQMNDEYTDLWKVFFESIAIKQRENYRCQRNLMPLWSRKHAVEFVNR